MNRAFVFSLLLLIVSPLAKAGGALVCDRQKVQQAIQFSRTSWTVVAYAEWPQEQPKLPVSPRLNRIFRDLEMKTFGMKFLIIEDFPMWPGLTILKNRIQFSSLTDKQLQAKLANPDIGAAFEIAHEMGHLIQEVASSPHGLEIVTSSADSLKFNLLHAETDCIAIEIIHQAGYPLTDDISKTISLITQECRAEQSKSFCDEADQIRQSTAREYIARIYSDREQANSAQDTKSPSSAQDPQQPKI